jgi:signal transduction histidine kinase/CheY-like chemotaxis protein
MKNVNSFAQELEFQRIDQLYRQNVIAPFIVVVTSAVLLIVGWNRIPHSYLILYASTWLIFAAIRAWTTWKWSQARAKKTVYSMIQLNRWHWIVIVSSIITGVYFGLLGVASRVYLGSDEQVYLGLVLLGMCAGTVAAYAVSLASSLGGPITAMSIWILGLACTGAPWTLIMYAVIYTLFLIRFGKNWNTYAMNSIRMNLYLHQNQEKLRLAMDSSGAASWSWDPPSDLFSCDANIAQVLGTPDSSFHTMQDYMERVHPEDRPLVNAAFSKALHAGTIDLEHRLAVTTNGAPRFVALRGRVQGGDGTSIRLSGIAWDITNKKNEDDVRFQRDLLEKSNHAKLMFLANVSHEIRTPLTAINGFTETVLSDSGLPLRFLDPLSAVLRNGKYLTSVVHDLLDLSKAEAGSIFIQTAKVVLPDEINDSIHVVRSAIEKKNLKLSVIYDSIIPEVVLSDATRLRQILINLLSNSVKYTDHGKIEIHVHFEDLGASGRLKIVVADTGIGMMDKDIRNLFQPFKRGDSLQVLQRQGSGLGLVLSRTLALKMAGDLRLLSTTPQTDTSEGGTAFELTIEVGQCQDVRRLHKHPMKSATFSRFLNSSHKSSFKSCRFLLVEDDEDIRWLLTDYLEKKGAAVVPCRHGGEAVQTAFQSHFDAVLMDIKMPVMNGYEATSLLRQQGFRHPVVALTAHANSSDMALCYEAGCDFYLSKPIDFGHLDDVLKRCIDAAIVESS